MVDLATCTLVASLTRCETHTKRAASPKEHEKALLDSFNVNVVGNIHLFNLYMPLILKGNAKKVITISTGMADLDLINKFNIAISAPYAISKAAMNVAAAKFNAQYAKDGVLFMSISPGLVDTGGFDNGMHSSLHDVVVLTRNSHGGAEAGCHGYDGPVCRVCASLYRAYYARVFGQQRPVSHQQGKCCSRGWRLLCFPLWQQAMALSSSRCFQLWSALNNKGCSQYIVSLPVYISRTVVSSNQQLIKITIGTVWENSA